MKPQERAQEVAKRRTFAIISHPDAGKTTITEQLLLFGGVIRQAGTVKGRKSGHFAKSDWMEIEKKRGISVTSSVMQFNYQGKRINILDTPGHEDFSEDTYRTLMAVDAAVMVIDSAKGIEAQTKKLFKVVKQRGIPIFTFMNKLDRDGREPLDLIAELEDLLGIEGYAMNWPIGMGKGLKGLYDRVNNRIELYRQEGADRFLPLNDRGELDASEPLTQDSIYTQTLDDIELLNDAGNQFNLKKIMAGDQTPVFFGSALTNFGVETFLNSFVKYAPEPGPKKTAQGGEIKPTDPEFSAFVFKIQANMNPAHRDRIAFVRIVSGEFDRGMDVILHRTGKTMRLNNSTEFMADSRETAVQLYKTYHTNEYILGAVGQLQFEVFQFRMLHEYHSEVVMTPIGSRIARWIDPEQMDEKMSSSRNLLVEDVHGDPLFLFENQYAERWFADKYPDVKLTAKL